MAKCIDQTDIDMVLAGDSVDGFPRSSRYTWCYDGTVQVVNEDLAKHIDWLTCLL